MPEAASRATITDFNSMRRAEVPIERAALYVGRKKSWGYIQEQKRLLTGGEPAAIRDTHRERLEEPRDDLSDAVEMIVALAEDDIERAFKLEDRFGRNIVPSLCSVAIFLADARATEMQQDLYEITVDEDWHHEVTEDPIQASDILETIPPAMRRRRRGTDDIPAHPPRVNEWLDRLASEHPESPPSPRRPRPRSPRTTPPRGSGRSGPASTRASS